MLVDKLDHLVLTVGNMEETCRFYADVLGMGIITFGAGRRALVFGEQKINLHEAGREIEPHALVPKPGSADLCFLTSTPIDTFAGHLEEKDIAIIAGPVQRTGAAGPLLSIYIRDPDGNLLEIANQKEQSTEKRNHET